MACVTAVASFAGMSALGGALGGAGLANLGGGIASSIGGLASAAGPLSSLSSISSITSAIPSIGGLSALSGGALGNLTSTVGNSITSFGSGIAGGALSNGIGSAFSSIGGGTFTSALGSHAGDLFGSGPLQAFQTFNAAESFSGISQGLAGSLQGALGGIDFGQAVSSLTSTLPINGDFGNFLGSSIGDIQGMVTNGLSSLTSVVGDMPNFAGELGSLGSAFDLGNLTEFGNPGQLIQAISAKGGLDITGITSALGEVGLGDVSISSLSNSIFNAELGDALGMIGNPQMIANAQALLGSSVGGLSSLADFTDIAKVMPASFDSIPFDDFSQLGEHLQGVELGSLANTSELGGLLRSVSTVDIPSIINNTQVIASDALSNITSNFLGGSGANGGILTSDLMGSVGGIGLTAQFASYKDAIDSIDTAGGFSAVNSLHSQLIAGINGDYLDVIGDPATSTDITDPFDSSVYTDLDSFVQAKQTQIEGAIQAVATAYPTETAVAQGRYGDMQRKVYQEKLHAGKTDLQLELRDERPDNAYHFVSSMQDRASRSDVIAIVEGMQDQAVNNGDIYGEYWRAYTAESKNRNRADEYNIRWRGEHLDEFEVI